MLRWSTTPHQGIEVQAVNSAILCAGHTHPRQPQVFQVLAILLLFGYNITCSSKHTANQDEHNVKEAIVSRHVGI